MSRRKGNSSGVQLVALWIPRLLVAALDQGVRKTDSDRSKFIRQAIREKISREKFQHEEAA